ncbi:hypothetical protein [uncultured Ruminococcus sp.]|uniref:hypothetical protein n=1 Tax=uncultured Ruminococcus sp. TaxID=165186 RepID=UPI00262E2E8E|nr:hypothetical protein [uncultured Ruminococcus sp.]
MKKSMRSTAFMLAAFLSFAAVSCGQTEESSPAAESGSTSVSVTETAEHTVDLETEIGRFEYKIETAKEQIATMPEFDPRAGINLTAEPMPEVGEIPSDWHEITNGKLTFKVPAEVKLGDHALKVAQNEDSTLVVGFLGETHWDEESTDLDTVYDTYFDTSYLSGEDLEAAEKQVEEYEEYVSETVRERGYPVDGELKNIEDDMKAMGLEYDGSGLSKYRALLSVTEKDRTDDNAEAFEHIAMQKALTFGDKYPGIRYLEADGVPVYLCTYQNSKSAIRAGDTEYKRLWISAFAEPDLEYNALINARSMEEALQIASTIKINRS